jgi:hydrogenase maturation protein HypF
VTESLRLGEEIRIRGAVQGVGFRPTVLRVALEHHVRGEVRNDGDGVLIRAWAEAGSLDAFVRAVSDACPPLASIDEIVRTAFTDAPPAAFTIAASERGVLRTTVLPDAAACAACLRETLDPFERRFRYPFTNCTHCGPRFSLVTDMPYDRGSTSMAAFAPCAACLRQYEDPADRRHHAQPIACHACGPRAWVIHADGRPLCIDSLTQLDAVDAVCALLERGEIVAIKGLGGFHLACDATRADRVAELRRKKQRDEKPFALMARSLGIIERYCRVSDLERDLLESPAAPIVVMDAIDPEALPRAVAPGQRTLGFMLPYTPLHALVLRRMERPIVLTSGNLGGEPQIIDNGEAVRRLAAVSPYLLMHDRTIQVRVDDSVVRVMAGRPRLLRRARGHAPRSLPLPPGLSAAAPSLAMGGELKSTFCLVTNGALVLSQHLGDLEEASTLADYEHNLAHYRRLFQHAPRRIVVDQHPDYLSTQLGAAWAERERLVLTRVQHHHAHVAACLADNGFPHGKGRVLGVALDGLGLGERGELWGGEFLLADYRGFEGVGTFKPVALLGGAAAMREPWRNTYAHLMAAMGWAEFKANFAELELCRFFETRPLPALATVLLRPEHAPLASSCGRLFDAVAAAIGVCRERASYEGQAAIELEALVEPAMLRDEPDSLAYPFAISRLLGNALPCIEPPPMWRALLGDLVLQTPPARIAARFHRGLARAIARMVHTLSQRAGERFVDHVALCGGVFQNRILLEQVSERLEHDGFRVLSQQHTPTHDGCLALGQAVVDAALQVRSS